MNCISWSITLVFVESMKSLSCLEDVGKLSNLVKYYVDLLSLVSLFLIMWVLLRRIHLRCLVSSSWLLPREKALGASSFSPEAQQVESELPRLAVGSCVGSKGISCCLTEIVCRSRSNIGTFCGIVCRSQNNVLIARGINFEGVDSFRNSSRVSCGGKDPIFI